MKSQQEPLETISHQAEICRFNADVLYRVLLLRIAKQYSPQEMSFLMGKPLDFVDKIERLQNMSFYLDDIVKMNKVLGSSFHIGCFTSSLSPFIKAEKELYQLSRNVYDDHITYQLVMCLDHNKTVNVFILQDNNPLSDYFEHSTEQELASLKRIIETLLQNGYFDCERCPFEIFEKCKSFLSDYIKPRNLYIALTSFTKRKEHPKLQYKKSKELGYYYIKKD